MCKAMEDMRNEALEEGKTEGKIEERQKNIRQMLRDRVSAQRFSSIQGQQNARLRKKFPIT